MLARYTNRSARNKWETDSKRLHTFGETFRLHLDESSDLPRKCGLQRFQFFIVQVAN